VLSPKHIPNFSSIPIYSTFPVSNLGRLLLLEFTEVDSCQRRGRWVDEEQGGRIVLVVSFVLEESIDRRVFW